MSISIDSATGGLGRKCLAVTRLVRPGNILIIGIGVVTGAALAAGSGAFAGDSLVKLSIAALSAMAVAGGANALNDVFDLEIDQRNRPDRPLAAGVIGRGVGALAWALLSVIGLVLAFLVSTKHSIFALVLVAGLFAYDAWLKRLPGVGNVVVSAAVSSTLVYGAMVVSDSELSLLGAAFAFATTLARELIKDLQDVEGDEAEGARTLALVLGARRTRVIAIALLYATVVAIPIPFVVVQFGGLYLLIGTVAAALLIGSAWNLFGYRNPDYAVASRLLKIAMVFGLAALLFAHIDG